MNSQEISSAINAFIALLSLFLTFYINKSKIDKKVKYPLIVAILFIGLLFIYMLIINSSNNSSESDIIIISTIDRTIQEEVNLLSAFFIIGILLLISSIFKSRAEISSRKMRGILGIIIILSITIYIYMPNLSGLASLFYRIPLDDMDSTQGWKIQHREGANGTFHIVEDPLFKDSKALEIDYNLGVNTAFVISKRKGFSIFGENMSKLNKIGFRFKANGSVNSLEFELTDQDGKCFGKKWRDVTGAANWTKLEVQIPDLKCWGCTCKGENEIVDLNRVVSFSFAISNRAGEEGGTGEVTIDEVTGLY